MHVAEGKLWKLSYPELAEWCNELARLPLAQVGSALHDEARMLAAGWSDALAINTHEAGGAARQAGKASALRKRTIELILKSHQDEPD
ncbi:MAG TPA: hypothetical protein VHA37_05580 [Candidatus Saccharimonadales bacterium]|nr:hypothetical protein [Candidatus Saccharimonadales bacterium]